jgi:proteasome lid subunit RPN8/RPN11
MSIEKDIVRYANECFPKECWGYVIENEDKHLSIVKVPNLSNSPEDSVVTNPEYYLKYKKNIVAFFHSHPTPPSSIHQFDIDICNEMQIASIIYTNYEKRFDYISPKKVKKQLEGRPFLYGVFDCYTCFRDAYELYHGIKLKDYKAPWGWWLGKRSLFEENIQDAGFLEIDIQEVKNGDGVLMRFGSKITNHIGYFKDDKILHQYQGTISQWEPVEHLQKNIVKAIRYKQGAPVHFLPI